MEHLTRCSFALGTEPEQGSLSTSQGLQQIMNIDVINPLALQELPYLVLANFRPIGISLVVHGIRFIEPPEEVTLQSVQFEGFRLQTGEVRFVEGPFSVRHLPFLGDPVKKSFKPFQTLLGNGFETDADIKLSIRRLV